ncbi:hypothetical protein CAOG_07860 [Capsaspora owczarzaki ATCC 30864]|uniref:Uncharacterized protein n=1 Tax=Capsaspora owczarzaki (strain ATCC 30864) TaxID=595528 RepID=A0A0D2W0L2_CAPO3|nr:hypothetical protein CAOG_07860 [Capsaspora owczarzaki ATCC 30864]KJE97757.1 hypothetical protein CAOG_007860 [Capsaspora owczarzaki ATCC 30864]|eukprot:XP_004342945.1 hypothetical protein CAOG_07860 [Capsaspora owczarzaki ATCC 30864]
MSSNSSNSNSNGNTNSVVPPAQPSTETPPPPPPTKDELIRDILDTQQSFLDMTSKVYEVQREIANLTNENHVLSELMANYMASSSLFQLPATALLPGPIAR